MNLPETLSQFADIGGVGERKLEKYGTIFLAVINDHLSGSAILH